MKDIILRFAASASTPSQTPQKVNADNAGDLTATIIVIINAVIGALGVVAVVIIIIGGVGYMTSSGDAGRVKKAKDTILYGLIGLVICVLAFAIVNFVIGNILSGS